MNSVADKFLDWGINWIVTPMIAILVLCLPILIVWFIWLCWQGSQSPTFSLRKDEWECSHWIPVTETHFMMIGNVMVPQTYTHNECVEWRKK